MDRLTPERRRRQTRDHLLAAAAEVFAQRGFHEATLEEVAAAAGFSKGAVYSNFTSKEDLFLSVLEHHETETFARVRSALEASDIPAGDRLGDFVQLAVENFELEQASAALYLEFWLYAVHHPEARSRLADIDRAQAQAIEAIVSDERSGSPGSRSDAVAVMARLVVALFHGIGIVGLVDPDAVDANFLEAAIRLVDRGLTDAAP